MISKRIVPVFLLKGSRLVKGTNFQDFIDVGDPVSQGMIYDAQGADEIVIVDIAASKEKRIINPKVINEMIHKCRLPITAGGGIRNIDDAHQCFKAGADKVVVNTHAILNPSLVSELAKEFGVQSVVVSLDVKKNADGDYEVYIFSGREKVKADFEELLKQLIDKGAGEIILTSIDQEGTLSGFDLELYRRVRPLIRVPLIASGGAGCYDDIVKVLAQTDPDACAIGKMLFLRDYDIVRIKSYLKNESLIVRDA